MSLRRAALVGFLIFSCIAAGCASAGPFEAYYQDHPDMKVHVEFFARGTKQIQPSPAWALVYEEVKACAAESGRVSDHAPYDELKWFWAEEMWKLYKAPYYRGFGLWGVYLKPRLTIVLAKQAFERPSGVESVVRHELLHHVTGSMEHEVELFTKCAPPD